MHYFPSMRNDGWMSPEDQENCGILLLEKNQMNSRDMHYIDEDKARGTWSKVVKDLKVHIYWKRKQVNLFTLWLRIFPNFFRNSSNSYGVYTLWGQFLLLLFTSWFTRTDFFVLKFNPAEAKISYLLRDLDKWNKNFR